MSNRVANRYMFASNLQNIVKELETAWQEGYNDPEPADERRFHQVIDNTCKNLLALKKGPADHKRQFTKIASNLIGVSMNYGSMGKHLK